MDLRGVLVLSGAGGTLDTHNTASFADDTINSDSGVGLRASLTELNLVTLKNNNATPTVKTDDKSYLALSLSGMSASLEGSDGLTVEVYNAAVEVSKGKGARGVK